MWSTPTSKDFKPTSKNFSVVKQGGPPCFPALWRILATRAQAKSPISLHHNTNNNKHIVSSIHSVTVPCRMYHYKWFPGLLV